MDRKSGTPRTIYVPSAAVSITGGVQPGILNRVLGYEHRENGLLPRLLLAMPPRRAKRWTEATIPEAVQARVEAIIQHLYAMEPDRDDNGDPRPHTLRLTPGGKAAWVWFYNEHAEEHAELTGELSAAWSKLEGYTARLALVAHCVRVAAGDPTLADATAVDETSIMAGATLSRWFGGEARRLYGILAESEDDRDHRYLVGLIQRKGGRITSRELRQSSRQYRGSTEAAEGALQELVDAGIGRWEQHRTRPRGGRPTRDFVLPAPFTPPTVYETWAGHAENPTMFGSATYPKRTRAPNGWKCTRNGRRSWSTTAGCHGRKPRP